MINGIKKILLVGVNYMKINEFLLKFTQVL